MSAVVKAAFRRNGGNGQLILLQQLSGANQTVLLQILHGGETGKSEVIPVQGGSGHGGLLLQIVDGQRLAAMLLEVVDTVP